MIQARDLRIGNLVIGHDNKQHKVTASGIVAQYQFDIAKEIGYKGVIITRQILLDCGFIENGDTSQFNLDGQTVSYNELDGVNFWIMDTDKAIRCYYLHQLQNTWFVFKGSEMI